MLSHQELEQIILKNNLTILSKKEHHLTRKTDSWRKGSHHRAGTAEHYFSFICKCPTEGCSNTFSIARLRDLNRTCRSCSLKGMKKEDKKTQEWFVFTTDVSQSSLPLAKDNPELFLREERTNNGITKRVILKCSTPNCSGEISSNLIGRAEARRTKCTSCAQKNRPYERAYNIATKRMAVRFPEGDIKWLLTYEDFFSLCEIPNCHYCNTPLNRAKNRTAEKQPKHALACLLDRKDSNKDYTLDNCVPCCPDCNFTKNERISYDEMVLIMKHRGLWVEDKQI